MIKALFYLVFGLICLISWWHGVCLAFAQGLVDGLIILFTQTGTLIGVVDWLAHVDLALKLHQLIGV